MEDIIDLNVLIVLYNNSLYNCIIVNVLYNIRVYCVCIFIEPIIYRAGDIKILKIRVILDGFYGFGTVITIKVLFSQILKLLLDLTGLFVIRIVRACIRNGFPIGSFVWDLRL